MGKVLIETNLLRSLRLADDELLKICERTAIPLSPCHCANLNSLFHAERSIIKNLKYMKLISPKFLIYLSVGQHNRTDRHVDLFLLFAFENLDNLLFRLTTGGFQ